MLKFARKARGLSSPAATRDTPQTVLSERSLTSPDPGHAGAFMLLSDSNNNISAGEPCDTPKLISEQDYENFLNNGKINFRDALKDSPKILEDLYEFHIVQQIGKGTFGKVLLAQHIKTRKYYALKVLNKKFYSDRRLIRNVISEKRYLYAMKHPFIVSLNFHFKNNVNLYLLMDFVRGGDLEYHLNRMKRFPESLVKFYAAQIVLAFEYLHSLNLVYRDLKPNNIVIDEKGYIKIVDFGLVKEVLGRTGTMVGTPEYFAPEIVLNRKYNKSLDWWTLGILIYHMMCGVTPFYHRQKGTMYANIHRGELQFTRVFSTSSRDIVNKLLQVDPKMRLGNTKDSIADIKAHPWFSDVNFINIFNKTVKPPWSPIKLNSSVTSFIPQQHEGDCEYLTEEDGRNESLAHEFDEF